MSDNEFIDAVVVKGTSVTKSVSIQVRNETDTGFVPFDLNPYAIRFRVLGSPTANAKVLIEKIITQVSDEDKVGRITNPAQGEFTFTINADDSINKLSLGNHPISIDSLDVDSLEYQFTLTEGGANGEFNKIMIVQV